MNKIGQIKIGAFFLSKLSSANVSKNKTTHNVKFIVLVFIYEIRVQGSYEIHKRIEVKYGPLKISNKSCLAEKSKFYTRKEGCTWKKCSAA